MTETSKTEATKSAATGAGRHQRHEIEIAADAESVWKAVSEAEELTRWFVEDAEVEPGEGGKQKIDWGQGVAMEATHLIWRPGQHLRVGHPDGAERGGWDAVVVDFEIEPGDEGRTKLRIVQSNLPQGEEWDGAYDGTEVGWRMFARSLKFYLERHAGEPRRTIHRYGNLELPRAEAWTHLTGAGLLASEGSLAETPEGGRFAVTAANGERLEGEVLLNVPERNFTMTIESDGYGDALLAFDLIPSKKGSYANFILGTFGLDSAAYEKLHAKWFPTLEKLLSTG